jgi:hypothetical protein
MAPAEIEARHMTKPSIDIDHPDRPEIEHFGNCPVCGALVDMRDLSQVLAHVHGAEFEIGESETASQAPIRAVFPVSILYLSRGSD